LGSVSQSGHQSRCRDLRRRSVIMLRPSPSPSYGLVLRWLDARIEMFRLITSGAKATPAISASSRLSRTIGPRCSPWPTAGNTYAASITWRRS